MALFSFVINGLLLTVPLYMFQIYDRVLTSRSESTLLMLTLVAGGLLLTLGLLELARSRVLVRVGARLDDRLNTPLLSAMLSDRLAGHSGQGQPLRDLEAVRLFLTGPGLLAFFDSPWIPVFIGLIFIFHPILGFVALSGAVILFVLAVLSELLSRRPLRDAATFSISAHASGRGRLRFGRPGHRRTNGKCLLPRSNRSN